MNFFEEYLSTIDGVDVEKSLPLFNKYYEFLSAENEKYNLTAISAEKDVFLLHFIDSLCGSGLISKKASLVDVGAGAGFPSLPIKIIRNDINLTLTDSNNKKVNFINNLISLLKIENTVALHTRAEDLAKTEFRESFDFATSRAVSKINTLLEYTLPLLKKGGKALLYKSADYKEELQESKNALKILGGEISEIKEFKLYKSDVKRAIIVIDKTVLTPLKYPRGKNLERKNPIV